MKSLRYIPSLNGMTGGINATLLMGQLEYWFGKTRGKAFYKFTEPCESNHYQAKDSWCEELGFSKAEFRSAFAKIGKVYKSKKAYLGSKDKFEGKYYLSYYDRIKHLTYYVRNEEKIGELYAEIESLKIGESRIEREVQEKDVKQSECEHLGSPDEQVCDLQEVTSKRCANSDSVSPISIDYSQRLQSGVKESCVHEEVLAIYHTTCSTLPPIRELTPQLRGQIDQFIHRIRQEGYTVQQILEKLASSDFLSGRLWNKGWRASLEWIMNGERYREILGDKYRNRESSRQTSKQVKQSRFHKIASHDWDIAVLEALEQQYIEKKLKEMSLSENPLLSRLRVISAT